MNSSVVRAMVIGGVCVLMASGVSASQIYWVDKQEDQILRCGLDGTDVQVLVDDLYGSFADVALDPAADMMYWTNGPLILRADLEGAGVETLYNSGGWIREIELDRDAGKMYWVDSNDGTIQRANLDGSGVEVLHTTATTGLRSLALDPVGGKMYWKDDGEIRRAGLDGSGVETLITGVENVVGMDLDLSAGKIYWTDTAQDKIGRANLDGSAAEDFLADEWAPFGIDVVEELGQLYWTDPMAGTLSRVNLDGSGYETLLTGLSMPWGLEVIPEPSALALLLSAALLMSRRRHT